MLIRESGLADSVYEMEGLWYFLGEDYLPSGPFTSESEARAQQAAYRDLIKDRVPVFDWCGYPHLWELTRNDACQWPECAGIHVWPTPQDRDSGWLILGPMPPINDRWAYEHPPEKLAHGPETGLVGIDVCLAAAVRLGVLTQGEAAQVPQPCLRSTHFK